MAMPDQDPLRLLRYMGLGVTDGVVAGWTTVLILKYLNIAGIGALITTHPDGALAYVMLLVFFAITFGMVGLAWRVMVMLPEEDD